MQLSQKNIELLKHIPFLRSAYCRWRIYHYRRLQRANFGVAPAAANSDKHIWQENVGGEIDFWNSLEAGCFSDRLHPDYLHSPELGKVLIRFLPQKFIKAIDVGCGPLSTLGKEFKGMRIERTLVDPLAPDYYPLLQRMQIPKEDWPEQCEGEELASRYPIETYQLAYMCNALDHCHDPSEVVKQLAKLIAPGGALYLEHFENEAEKEHYHGLHQWNLYEEGGDLWIANRSMKSSLRQLLGPTFSVVAHPVFRHGGFVVATAIRNK